MSDITIVSNSCPTEAEWLAFATGQIDDLTLHDRSRHLLSCPNCLQVVERISTSPSKQRTDEPISPFLEEANFHRLQQWLHQISILPEPSYETKNILDESSPTEPPELLGRFVVNGVLGTGGFGRVYLAYDPLLKRSVAIKAPRQAAFGTDGGLSLFLNEARHAAALDHPNIVPIHDVLADQSGRTLIVMKYVPGQPLSSMIRKDALSLQTAVQMMSIVARAVHFAHERGFVHRDLKPSNILVDEQGRPHVTDFGLGVNLSQVDIKDVCRAGTPAYMSPEQVRHDLLQIDRRSDVWALGIMLAELVHGRRPFPQKDRDLLYRAIQFDEPLIESAKETSELDQIAKKCLAKSRDDRFATANELAIALQSWQNRHFPKGIRKWMYGWRRNLLAASTVLVVCLSSLFIIRQSHQREVDSILNQLKSAPADQVAGLIQSLVARKVDSSIASRYPRSESGSDRWRLELASFALGEPHIDLANQLLNHLQNARPDEIAAAVEALKDGKSCSLLGSTAHARISPDLTLQQKIVLYAIVCGLDGSRDDWGDATEDIANSLIRLPAEEFEKWRPLFDSIGSSHLATSLTLSMNSSDLPIAIQHNAAVALARYWKDNVDALASLLANADPNEMSALLDSLGSNQAEAVEVLLRHFRSRHEQPRIVQTDDDATPSQLDQEMSRLAIGLWILGEPSAVFDALRHDPDPTLQTLVIHGLKTHNCSSETILRNLVSFQEKTDPRSSDIKFGLLQALALLSPVENSLHFEKTVAELYRNDPDPGVHSAARLVCSKNTLRLDSPPLGDHGGWFTAKVGDSVQDFVVLKPCQAEVGLQNRQNQKLLSTPWPRHKRVYRRRTAIAVHELTIEQFGTINPDFHSEVPVFRDAESCAAMMLFQLNSAYEFCNALSERASLETCYETRELQDGLSILVPKANHVELNGYRLPTDGEWELACRSGTATSRYFGNAHEVATSYGWIFENNYRAQHNQNGAIVSQKVATYLPNRWGLFDCYGNAMEICDMSVPPGAQTIELTEDGPADLPNAQRQAPLLRGASFENGGASFAEYARSHCRTYRVIATSISTIGLRLARTLSTAE